jgi:hypothetical protein
VGRWYRVTRENEMEEKRKVKKEWKKKGRKRGNGNGLMGKNVERKEYIGLF